MKTFVRQRNALQWRPYKPTTRHAIHAGTIAQLLHCVTERQQQAQKVLMTDLPQAAQ